MSSPYSYTCIRPIQLQTRLVRPGNVFPVINSPMVVLSGPGEEESIVPCSQERYTSGPSALRAHINDGPLNSWHADTCRCPIIEIRGNLRKYCTSISFKNSRLTSMVQFFQGIFPAAPMAEI
ncbi:hypothetical protein AVEN_173726-1 [Araneus ventricosus]|uniref:Uncharacterized protein n=1 Tax=Araneus ventricosus TaxID=182803 RepID=A0A4Y2UL02_ARAVE|nr:hypothetical protein AVEN_70376-1 [Araneus ventricosus]GBO12273.1 hypothetical protein AVEN_173726-1 [Araneus ventricosus]